MSRGALLAAGVAAALAAVLAGGGASAGPGAAAGAGKYVGAAKCKTCHGKDLIGDQYSVWKESKHAKALATLATEKAKKWAAERGIADPQASEECVRCHVTAHGVDKALLPLKHDPSLGVQCEACHGPGSGYYKKKIMMDRDLAVSKGLVLQSEKVCTACHNDESPAWDPTRYTRPDGRKVGFDYEQAVKQIAHPVPAGYDPAAEGGAE